MTHRPQPFFHGGIFGFIHKPPRSSERTGIAALFLNAGLLHNVGPFRLYVDLANALAGAGITAVRIDQSGKGESFARTGVDESESLVKDYDDILAYLARLGIDRVILVGLCSAADDALELGALRESVAGIVMLDGFAPRDGLYFWRRYSRRALDVRGWIDAVRRRLRPSAASADDLDIRRWHGRDVMLGNIRRFLDRGGRMFAVFTGGVSSYYNNAGQLARALENDSGLTERYFPRVAHTYPMNADRIELIGHVVRWADANFAAEVSRPGPSSAPKPLAVGHI